MCSTLCHLDVFPMLPFKRSDEVLTDDGLELALHASPVASRERERERARESERERERERDRQTDRQLSLIHI